MKLLKIWGIILLVIDFIIFLSLPNLAPYGEGLVALRCFCLLLLLLSITVFLIAYVMKKQMPKS